MKHQQGLTMSDIAERADVLLKEQLSQGQIAYNYKLLSRELGIHVNDAKRLLYTFHQKHKTVLDATYVIVGILADSDTKTIKLTADLSDKDLFSKIESIQVYSITAKNIKISEVLVDINIKLHQYTSSEDNLKKWGVIKGPEIAVSESPIPSSEPASRAPTVTRPTTSTPAKTTEEEPNKTTKEPDMTLLSERILARNRPASGATDTKKKVSQPSIGKAFTNQTARSRASTQSKRASTTDPVPIAETIEDDDLNDEEYAKKKQAEKEAAEKKRRDLESMFSDDDDFEVIEDESIEEASVETKETKDKEGPVQKEESIVPQKRSISDLEDIDFDSSFSHTQSQSQPAPKPTSEKEGKEEEKEEEGEGDEGAETKSSYYDEDGYLVTVQKTAPKAKAKPAPATTDKSPKAAAATSTAAAKKKSGPKQQSSLMSFFGKK